jgi:hypothetical protein
MRSRNGLSVAVLKDCDAFGSKHHEFNQSNFASLKMLILIKRKDRCFFTNKLTGFNVYRLLHLITLNRLSDQRRC